MGKKESIADTARVLGRMYEGIEYRGFGQEIVEELAKQYGMELDPRQLAVRSEAFAVRSGGRSARVAKQFIELCKAGVFS